MAFPLFDANFTLWAADLDTRLMEQHGRSAVGLGIDAHTLRERFYRGESVAAAFSTITDGLSGGK